MRARRSKPMRGRRDEIHSIKVLTPTELSAIETYLRGRWTGSKKPHNRHDLVGFRDLLMFLLFINTGIRRCELCHLRLKDTSQWLGENAIYIFKTKYCKDRSVPVSARLADLVKHYIENYRPGTTTVPLTCD